MFTKILIANRGEIAVRVARTARRLGIRTVAVYSDADANAAHVAACDEAHRLGPPPPRESYLDGARILALARATGAQAIHPGYGFLSENEAFAKACAEAGIVFIGPPPGAIAAMGSKSAAKAIMGKAGVPLVPGYHGDDQDPALLAREAAKIGFPVLIKATAGGGGKGMKIVRAVEEFAGALASAKREALAGFGDDRVLVERYLSQPRHIEIQVFGDAHGRVVSLFERDCSVQRRHQKVLEEAPAPGMTPERRRAMGEAAVAAAKAIGYVGAGTVEFIAEQDGRFYFMEMNTRLQVEHPVTEMITGLDLVEWQLRVASGEPLPLAQQNLAIRGHAIEARLYAEDPDRGFLPSIGRIAHWRMPEASARVRIDTGFSAGDEVSPWYDPMLAKLVVWGEDRERACATLLAALADCEVAGVSTNVAFLERVVAHEAFATGRLDTGLIEKHHAALFPPAGPTQSLALVAAAVDELAQVRDAAGGDAADPHSPWRETDAWWVNSASHAVVLRFRDGEATSTVRLTGSLPDVAVEIGGRRNVVRALHRNGRWSIDTGERRVDVSVVRLGEDRLVFARGLRRRLTLVDPLAHAGEEEAHGGHLTAPMSGTIVAVPAKVGERVERGAPLVVLEAMKMEHSIVAPAAGVVAAIHFRVGDRVSEGADLVDLEDAPGT
ncbi:MAG: acetyl/propionyl/methylcrotonyl-CoA carboxylase subunit alpha [Betaproteobacteria bacterium PRO3]|nr:acetyl/propionyl/methylcrotonyl-CoA carboxylase subunit alpha [Betaproteobacteria bacterium PRO3]